MCLDRQPHDPQSLDRSGCDTVEPRVDVRQQQLRSAWATRGACWPTIGGRGRGRTGNGYWLPIAGIAVDQIQVAEGVVQVHAQGGRVVHLALEPQRPIAPGDQIMFLRQRKRIGVVRLGLAFRFRERHLRRQSRQRRSVVRAVTRVQQHQAPGGDRMVARGGEDQSPRTGNRPGLEETVRIARVVAVHRLHARAVRERRPQAHVVLAVAIDVIPARVEDPPLVVHAGCPLEHLERRDRPQVAALPRPSRAACTRHTAAPARRRSGRSNPAARIRQRRGRPNPCCTGSPGRGAWNRTRSRRWAGSGRRSRRTCRASAAAGPLPSRFISNRW